MARQSAQLEGSVGDRDSWFTRPLSLGWCIVGWCVASGVFIAFVAVPGGPAVGDAWESIYATWAVSHWQIACMYPPHFSDITTFTAPVYPLFTGALGALGHVGDGVHFPAGAALGHNCSQAVPAMVHWSRSSGALWPTLRTGYLSWLFLMAGVIWFLRSTQRRSSGWEPTALVIVAALPPVWMALEMYFHPQDILAMGFVLASLGSALRNQWIAAGVLIALAVLSQQYALLGAIPLLVVAIAARRWSFLVAAFFTGIVIAGPILIVNGGRATRFLLLGSGDAAGIGGTLVWELQLNGAPLVLLSRITPLVLSLALAVYVVRRMGLAVLKPGPLLALVAVSFSFRLVFEQNIFGYYFMALAVCLVVLDVLAGRIRQPLVAWLLMVSLVYSEAQIIVWRQPWGQDARRWIPFVVILVALFMILRSVTRHQIGWNLLVWVATVVCALVMWPVSSDPLHYRSFPVTWLWQLILVGIGIVLAAVPLWEAIRGARRPETTIRTTPEAAVATS